MMKKALIITLVVIITIAILAIAGLFVYYTKNKSPAGVGEFDNKNVYYLKFEYDKNFEYTPAEEGLADFAPFEKYVSEFLLVQYSRVFFDSTKNDYSQIESGMGYYILIDNKKDIDTSKTYDKNGLNITIQKSDQNLLPYFKDSMYCNIDSDCSIRSKECSEGSFNKFNPYHGAWGCEGYTFYPNEGENQWKLCNSKEIPVIEYFGGSKCINNKCTPLDKKVSCIPNTLP